MGKNEVSVKAYNTNEPDRNSWTDHLISGNLRKNIGIEGINGTITRLMIYWIITVIVTNMVKLTETQVTGFTSTHGTVIGWR